MSELVVRPEITLTFEQRKASSGCCGARLDLARVLEPGEAPSDDDWLCRSCRQPCERVLGDPVEVIARG